MFTVHLMKLKWQKCCMNDARDIASKLEMELTRIRSVCQFENHSTRAAGVSTPTSNARQAEARLRGDPLGTVAKTTGNLGTDSDVQITVRIRFCFLRKSTIGYQKNRSGQVEPKPKRAQISVAKDKNYICRTETTNLSQYNY